MLELNISEKNITGRSLSKLIIYAEDEEKIRELVKSKGELRDYEYHYKTLKGKDKCARYNAVLGKSPGWEAIMTASYTRTDYQLNMVITSFKIRIFNILVVLAGVHVIRDAFGVAVPAAAMSAFYAWLLTCSVYLALFSAGFFRTDKAVAIFHFSYYFFGVSYVTMLAHYLGGGRRHNVLSVFY